MKKATIKDMIAWNVENDRDDYLYELHIIHYRGHNTRMDGDTYRDATNLWSDARAMYQEGKHHAAMEQRHTPYIKRSTIELYRAYKTDRGLEWLPVHGYSYTMTR